MTDVIPTMKKVEAGGISNDNKAEINDRAGLFFGAFGMLMGGVALAVCWVKTDAQDDKIRSLETQVMLMREDIREQTIEEAKRK